MKFKFLRKVASLLLVSTILFSAAGCGDKSDKTNSTGETNSESKETKEDSNDSGKTFAGKKLTIGIWGGNDAETNAIEAVKKSFEEKTGATVEFKVYTEINTQLQADFIAKTAPDAFYIDASRFPFYSEQGVLEPLDPEEMGAKDFYPNLLSAFTAKDGTLYCLPKDASTLALYYNVGLLEEVGLAEKDIPTNWEDYKTFLPELQKKLDEKHGAGEVTAMTVNLELARNLHLIERDGASVSDESGKSTMNSEGIKKNLQLILDLWNTKAYKTPTNLGLGWNGEAFGAEKTVIMDEGNWVYGFLKQNYPDIKFGVKDMPAYEGKKSSMSFTVGYAISTESKEKELAKEWIKYATGVEGMSTWCSGAGTLPSRDDVAKALKVDEDPVLKTHLAQIEYAVPWQKGTTVTVIDDAYKNFIVQAFDGQITLDDALTQIDEQANTQIGN